MPVGLTLVKRTSYRGDTDEEFSNTYHFEGAVPADAAAWKTLADALIAQEKTVYNSQVFVVRWYGYDSDAEDAVAVASRDLVAAGETVAGTLAQGTGIPMAGDQAAWCRWKTSRLTSRGKPIYLRKYFHKGFIDPADADKILPAWKTALQNFATELWDGSFLDGRTIRARGTSDETIVGSNASTYVTTRTLKRRGRRPPTP